MTLTSEEARTLELHFRRIIDDTATNRGWIDSLGIAGFVAALEGKSSVGHTHMFSSITDGTEGVRSAMSGLYDPTGAAAAAELAAKAHADTLAFGTQLEVTDATVADLARSPSTELGAIVAGKIGRGELVFNVMDYGASNTGASASQAAFNAAAIAAEAVGGIVYAPGGDFQVNSSILMKSRVHFLGAGIGATRIQAAPGLTTAVFLGTSGSAVRDASIVGLSVDGGAGAITASVNGIQVSAGSRVVVHRAEVKNTTAGGIVFGTGSVDCTVELCRLDTLGTINNAHAIQFTSGSHRGKARGNRITNSRGAGVWIGNAGNGCVECEITGNYIETIDSPSSMEGIGVTPDCPRAIIQGNHVINSKDNGISISSPDSTVFGNIIEGAWGAGIGIGGDNVIVVGNRIRNCGQDMTEEWGGIGLGASNCVIVGNVIYDDQATHTMSYGVKEFAFGNDNIILGNRIYGYTLAEFRRVGSRTLALTGTRPTITGSRGGNAALGSLLTQLANAGLILDTTIE